MHLGLCSEDFVKQSHSSPSLWVYDKTRLYQLSVDDVIPVPKQVYENLGNPVASLLTWNDFNPSMDK